MMFNSHHRMRYIHAIIIFLALVIPTTSVAVIFGTGGFINGRFPPLLCLPRNADAGFYAVELPISIITPSGVTLLIVVFWAVHKVGMSQHIAYAISHEIFKLLMCITLYVIGLSCTCVFLGDKALTS